MTRFARSEGDLFRTIRSRGLRDDEAAYLAFHLRRFTVLLTMLDRCAAAMGGPRRLRLLDIGPGMLTDALRAQHPDLTIDSLGFEDTRCARHANGRHVEFDLLGCALPGERPRLQPYDIVVMAEVLEHLSVAPDCVLAFVRSLMADDGCLILQTPNACALPKRLRMLRGHNPFEMIRQPGQGAGHFREYTRNEMHGLARTAGLRVEYEHFENYFRRDTRSDRLFRALGAVCPPTWRNGMSFILTRDLPRGSHPV